MTVKRLSNASHTQSLQGRCILNVKLLSAYQAIPMDTTADSQSNIVGVLKLVMFGTHPSLNDRHDRHDRPHQTD